MPNSSRQKDGMSWQYSVGAYDAASSQKKSHQICIHEFSQPGFTGHEMGTPASMALIQVCAI
jgi:hypothetical protein